MNNQWSDAAKVILAELLGLALLCAFLALNKFFHLVLLGAGLGLLWLAAARKGYAADLKTAFRRQQRAAVWGLAVLIFLYPLLQAGNPYNIYLVVIAGLYVTMALGLDYMVGGTDQVNLGFAGIYAVGAYTSALLTTKAGISFWLALPTAALAAAAAGLLLGIPALKTKGYYLSLVTIAFGLIVETLARNLQFTGGPSGIRMIPAPEMFGHSFREPIAILGLSLPAEANYYYLVVLIVLLAAGFSWWLYRSSLGLAWNAIRDDEIAAKCYGINVGLGKLLAFVLGSLWGGVAGSVYAHLSGYIAPTNFQFFTSVMMVSMVVLGGMGNVAGVVVGAALLAVMPEKFRLFADYRLFFFGALIVVMVIYRPQGLFPARPRSFERYLAPPRSQAPAGKIRT